MLLSLLGRPMRNVLAAMMLVLTVTGATAAPRITNHDVLAMAQGLIAVSHDHPHPGEAIATYLQRQAQQRHLAEAFVIDSRGQVMVSTMRRGAPAFRAPSADVLARARSGRDVIAANGFAVVWLSSFDDAYLVVETD